jgi:diguanylate cyclase (GGDEF)-like protein
LRPIQPLEPDEATIAMEARAERARVFNQRAITGALTSPLGFLLLGWAIYQMSGLNNALAWLAVVVCNQFIIVYMARRFLALDAAKGASCPWARAQVLYQTVAGLVWGATIWFTPQNGQLLGYLATLTILVGVMGYSVVTMCLYPAASWGFFGGLFAMLMLHLLMGHNPLKTVIAVGLCAQLASQILGTSSLRAMMLKDIDAHVRNKALAELMSTARAQLEQVHADVQAKNAQLNAAITQLNDLVAHDQLTGAYSRRYMFEQMERLASLHLRYGQPVCLIMLDLDHFKIINDRFGHPAGDRALTTVVNVVSAQLRDGDMLGRVGGEEFLALMPMTDLESASLLAERLRVTLSEVVFTEGHQSIHLPASFGVAELIANEGVNHWFRRVDSALYQAKTQGRNAVVVAHADWVTRPTSVQADPDITLA